ncbi:LytTR family transcriptional regulator [Bacillus atrophaeus]|uniref:M28 family peptidase n=1 Tax=Bacillus atrophaeus TaxID=1452 RepID=UPI000C05A6A0|nr:M28 family peptidase [Bacillus atrophaeus]ATO27543.1 LytTR family transcriptional regulator [Bacillus atrophaeus]MCY8857761.1 M28 family peptidase [Bacillus atrophaeus]MCY9197657.1 M28 family peptidase [Bacillus atrophaeus]MEC2309758.1 M28 family peptidase [Bacillus atrophaeus]PSA94844.1 LytTR family transcriptional regulator [Bacillus atrophaeus]
MKYVFMSAALAASFIWGVPADLVKEKQIQSASVIESKFDADGAFETIHDLSETIGPRETGTDKEKEAAEYLSNRLRAEGVSVRMQPFELKNYFSGSITAGDHEFPIRSADDAAVKGEVKIDAPIYDGGYGLSRDLKGAEGRIAVIREGKIPVSQKIKHAEKANAAAVIIYNHKTKPLAIRPNKEKNITIPAAGMKKEDGEALLKEKQAVIQFKNYQHRISRNVIGTRKAKSSKHPDIIYVTAHYDSVQGAPGADDNASGTSAVLEMSKMFKNLPDNKEIRFILFGSEELWSAGSSYYVSKLTKDEIKQSQANFNADMIATDWKEASQLFVTTPDGKTNQSIRYAVNAAEKQHIKKPSLIQLGYSDHVSFYEAGIASANWIWLSPETNEPGPWYHTSNDNMEHINKDRLKSAGELISASVSEAIQD